MVTELPGCQTVPPPRSHLKAGEVHDRLDEDGVVADVRVLGIELGERAEERTAAGDVHLAHGSLEGGGSDVRSKGVDDVLPVALVQQHQSHLEIRQMREITGMLTRRQRCNILGLRSFSLDRIIPTIADVND